MRKIIVLLMCATLLTVLTSCKHSEQNMDEAVETVVSVDSVSPEERAGKEKLSDYALNEFDQSLIDYLLLNGYYDSTFIVSPAAFRASLCLAAAGAEGNTRTELVSAAGFSGMDELNVWYQYFQGVTQEQSCFGAASIWNDQDLLGDFTDFYQMQIQEQYGTDVYVCSADALTANIDNWISNQTDGQISSAQKDVYGASSVLASAMYMQTLWASDFSLCESGSSETFMEQTGRFLYTEENGTQILVLPMQGNLSFVCFSGNRMDMFDKLASIKKETVHVVLPEFEMESVFDATDLLNFLLTRGIDDVLNGQTANFHNMCQDADWFLQEMIQTAKISVNATDAVTGSSDRLDTDSTDDEREMKEFVTDCPLSFIIFYGFGTPNQQVLLYGQNMG